MDLLLLGSNYFQKSLIRQGHRVIWAGDHPDCDLCLPLSRLDLPHILAQLSFSPQAVILTDDLGRRVWPTGLEKTSALKVWYAVDGPINYFWQKHYAPLFDLVLADQKDCAERLGRLCPSKVHWLPVGVDTKTYIGPPEKKTHDLGFVGVINDRVRPKRSRIINLLRQRYRLYVAGGRRDEWVSPKEAALLYRHSRLVLNENLFDGVTTRIFEAMASGTMLLTEAGGNGLTDLFIPGEDLACYGPDNLVELADFYLADAAERERVAAQGQGKVLAAHDIKHRTQKLVDLISQARPGAGLQEGGPFFGRLGKVFFLAGTRWPRHNGDDRILKAEVLLKRSMRLGGSDPEAMFYLGLISGFKGDKLSARTRLGGAAESGSIRARLALAFFDLKENHESRATGHIRAAAQAMGLELPGGRVCQDGLSADRHFILGRILEARGHGLTPGFSRFGLDMSLWNALEHYRAAVKLDPEHTPALIKLGGLLAGYGAWAEAHPFLARAAELNPESTESAQTAALAARKGYALSGNVRKVA